MLVTTDSKRLMANRFVNRTFSLFAHWCPVLALFRSRGSWLTALGGVGERGIGSGRRVHEGREPPQLLGVFERRLPLVLVRVDVRGHRRVEVLGDAEAVVEDDRAQGVDAALHLLEPRSCALQWSS